MIKRYLMLIFIASIILIQKVNVIYAQSDWLYPRHDLLNSASSSLLGFRLNESPVEKWSFKTPTPCMLSGYWVIGDVDADGELETVVSSRNLLPGETGFVLALNCQDGSILWEFNFDDATGSGGYFAGPFITDIENDDSLEVVCCTYSNIYILKGKDGSIVWQKLNDNQEINGTTIADINDDGFIDIIAHIGMTLYLLNGKDGSEIWSVEIPGDTCGGAYNIPAAGDIDGDGNKEILCHNHIYNPNREREYCWDKDGNEKWHFDSTPTAEQYANAPPELGYPPDYGYTSSIIMDFDGDGEKEVGFGTNCNYYLLDKNGKEKWKVPMRKGHGVAIIHFKDGTTYVDEHGLGGLWSNTATGDIDNDGIVEVVLSIEGEMRHEQYEDSIEVVSDQIPSNKIVALDGRDGALDWEFEGEYRHVGDNLIGTMGEPILVDLDGDSLLDVLVSSDNGYFYGIKGTTGEQIWKYEYDGRPDLSRSFNVFCEDNELVLLYNSYEQLTALSFGTFVDVKTEEMNYIEKHDLFQNYPNPFNIRTSICYQLKSKADINLTIHNVKGEIISNFSKANQQAGYYQFTWDGKDNKDQLMPSGLYFYRLKAGNFINTKRMLLLK